MPQDVIQINRDDFIELSESMDELYNSIVCGYVSEIDKSFNKLNDIVSSFFENKRYKIRSFFLEGDRRKEINRIYDIIRNNEMPYNKIDDTPDVNICRSLYTDYANGLVDFVDTIVNIESSDSISVDKVSDRVEAMVEKDRNFIDGIFGNIHVEWETQSITDAMKQVEALIDIIPNIDVNKTLILNEIGRVKTIVLADSTSDGKLEKAKVEAIFLLVKSYGYFMEEVINKIFEIYNKILYSISNRESAIPANYKMQIID